MDGNIVRAGERFVDKVITVCIGDDQNASLDGSHCVWQVGRVGNVRWVGKVKYSCVGCLFRIVFLWEWEWKSRNEGDAPALYGEMMLGKDCEDREDYEDSGSLRTVNPMSNLSKQELFVLGHHMRTWSEREIQICRLGAKILVSASKDWDSHTADNLGIQVCLMPVSEMLQSVEQERSGECAVRNKSQSVALPFKIDDIESIHSSAMLPMATR